MCVFMDMMARRVTFSTGPMGPGSFVFSLRCFWMITIGDEWIKKVFHFYFFLQCGSKLNVTSCA